MNIEAVVAQITKLDLEPGQVLAIICPESWNPRQIHEFSEHFHAVHSLPEIDVVFLPHGVELAIAKASEGFGEKVGDLI